MIGLLFALVGSCTDERRSSQGGALTIATAASMAPVMEEIAAAFQDSTGIAVELIKGASGQLANQILNGAPIDVFLSADTSYPGLLQRAGFANRRLRVFAEGSLWLWTSHAPGEDLAKWLQSPQVSRIALANIERAPYGRAAWQYLESAKLAESLQTKLVFGESIAQVNLYIREKAVDAAFVPASSRIVLRETRGMWTQIPRSTHSRLQHSLVTIEQNPKKSRTAPEKFLKFLSSSPSYILLKKYGYHLPEKKPK